MVMERAVLFKSCLLWLILLGHPLRFIYANTEGVCTFILGFLVFSPFLVRKMILCV